VDGNDGSQPPSLALARQPDLLVLHATHSACESNQGTHRGWQVGFREALLQRHTARKISMSGSPFSGAAILAMQLSCLLAAWLHLPPHVAFASPYSTARWPKLDRMQQM
jgi:hypothetical protein